MQSLTRLIRDAAADNPLARALEAILDSGMIIFSRDNEGRFVQLSGKLTERAGLIAPAGASQPRNMRVFNSEGRLLAGSEYPASITRRTGAAQRDVLTRVVSDDDRHLWLQLSTMPLERGAEGWSVLSVAADVTDLVDDLESTRREVAARGELLTLATSLAGPPRTCAGVIERLGSVLATILPSANATLVSRHGMQFHSEALQHGYGTPFSETGGRFTEEQQRRWSADRAHVNLDVQDTDIYDSRVVAEMANPVRSIVIAPFGANPAGHVGAIVVLGEQPNAFSDDRIESLEHLGRIAGHALPAEQPLARSA